MRFFRKLAGKLVRMAIHAWEGYVCRKCGQQTLKPVSGITCGKGGSHDWVWVSR